jgi:hypothetical protein
MLMNHNDQEVLLRCWLDESAGNTPKMPVARNEVLFWIFSGFSNRGHPNWAHLHACATSLG